MCCQLPGSITRDGKPIIGGADINRTDYQFAGKIYLKAGPAGLTEGARESHPSAEQEQPTTGIHRRM